MKSSQQSSSTSLAASWLSTSQTCEHIKYFFTLSTKCDPEKLGREG
jgi:hypothetical protein